MVAKRKKGITYFVFEIPILYINLYVKAENIVLKNKGNQNAVNPQNPTPQGQPKK